MVKWIILGKYNSYYKYMIFYLISKGINDCIKGFANNDLYEDMIFFGDDTKRFFYSHELINTTFGYFGIFLFYIIYKYFDDENDINSIELIHDSTQNEKHYNENGSLWNVFLVTFLWVIEDLLLYAILINFWTLKMVFTYFIGKAMFNIQIYKHQIFSIYFISIVCSLLFIITLILSILKDEKNKFRKNPEYIPIGILIYLLNLLIESFTNWKCKWLVDLKFTSSSKVFMYYGILGFIIYSLICIIATFLDCDDGLLDFCKLEKNNFKYFESVIIYFDDLSKKNIILLILFTIIFALKSFFYMLTIKHLTPFHLISMPTIYYFFKNIILGIYTFSKKNKSQKDLILYILEIVTCFLAFFGFSVFLEFIELNFCMCNYNLRRYIVKRGIINDDLLDDSVISNEEEEKEEEDAFQN